MKALTLHRPWAELVATGVKTIETRSWSVGYRGLLAIHASVKDPDWAMAKKLMPYVGTSAYLYASAPPGTVIATCELVDVVPIFERRLGSTEKGPRLLNFYGSKWDGDGLRYIAADNMHDVSDQLPYGDFSDGRYAWILEEVVPVVPPAKARGHQGLWEWERPLDLKRIVAHTQQGEVELTESIRVLYDCILHTNDYQSGHLDYEESAHLLKVARVLGAKGLEEAEHQLAAYKDNYGGASKSFYGPHMSLEPLDG